MRVCGEYSGGGGGGGEGGGTLTDTVSLPSAFDVVASGSVFESEGPVSKSPKYSHH